MRSTPAKAFSVYKTKTFARFAQKARIADLDLWEAAHRANDGVSNADLGSGLVKQRIARVGEGKSGGSRTILALRKKDRAIYIFGFEKKDLDNIDSKQLKLLRILAKVLLGYNVDQLNQQVRSGELHVVKELREGDDGDQVRKSNVG